LPIPELLRLLATPLLTGGLAVVAMSIASFAFLATHSWQSPRLLEAAALGIGPLARLVIGYCLLWFLAGAALLGGDPIHDIVIQVGTQVPKARVARLLDRARHAGFISIPTSR
jgi:hypothetical protein